MTKAPCGCLFGPVGDTFVVYTCSNKTCVIQDYVVAEFEAQNKPLVHVSIG